MKNIFLTGGTGLLGLNLYFYFKNKYKIYINIFKKKIPKINFVKINLNKVNEVRKFLKKKKIDYLIHCAAITNIEECEKNKKKAKKINITLAKNLSIICNDTGTKFIFISTDHLFDGKKKIYKETDNVTPLNYYAKTKAEAEKEILKNNNSSLIIRTNFFGFGPHYRNSFSDWIIESLKKGNKINVFNDVYFNPINIIYLLKFLFKILKNNIVGIVNITSDKKLSKYQFALRLAKKFKLNSNLIIPTSFNKIRKKNKLVTRPKNMTLSNKKLKIILKIKYIDIDKMINSLYLSRLSKTILSIKKIK